MSSRGRSWDLGPPKGSKCLVDDASESAFEAAESLCGGIPGQEPPSVVAATSTVEAYLGDGDSVQGAVQLPVPGSRHADPAGGVA
jgi:hypothetical protein